MSNKKLAVIMDPIQDINPHKDSSLAMLLEAQKRGYEIYCGDLADIWLDGAMPRGRLTKVKVFDDNAHGFEIVETVHRYSRKGGGETAGPHGRTFGIFDGYRRWKPQRYF